MIKTLLPRIPNPIARNRDQQRALAHRQLIRQEAKMGGQLFGPVPDGHRREFFCLDRYSWVWHEEWLDDKGMTRSMTTRYDIRPQGILKSQGNSSFQLVIGDELRNFYQAAHMYRDNLNQQLAQLSR